MKIKLLIILCALAGVELTAATLTVNTTNNVSPAAGQISLLQALKSARDGDEIRFDIPGAGPHYIQTPAEGYPLITVSNLTIDGYSQFEAAPNSNSILSSNNARIEIVLDSRTGGFTPMTFPLTSPNDDRGYLSSEGAVLGVVDAQNLTVRGLSFLGVPLVGVENDISLGFISFGRGASGHINGCWLGVDPDGKTVAGAANGITGFRYQGRDAAGTVTNAILVNDLVIGVAPKTTNAPPQFNVIAGMPIAPINIEGNGTRISGNFITVLPDGVHDFNVAVDETLQGRFAGAIAIGRSGNNTLIGVDGDGIGDENERNVFGGMLPFALEGYEHLIEFYGTSPGTNIVIAGNYIGIGIDGKTKFTNGVPVLNATGGAAEYRIGSNLDGTSDKLEGNLIANNYPPELFPAADFQEMPESLSFLSQLNPEATVSLRGNSLINNFPFPTSPLRDGGNFLVSYYAKALLDSTAYNPTLATNSTRSRLKGTVPLRDPSRYSETIVDVYTADPVGITNGVAAGIPELPQGFVQGLNYLGSFVEGSGADLDPKEGAFEFDITSLNVAAAAQLTVTANYLGVIAVPDAGPGNFSEISRGADGSVILRWSAGVLQSASVLTGPWTDETTTGNTFTTAANKPMEFYRLSMGGSGEPAVAAAPLTSPFSNAVTVQ